MQPTASVPGTKSAAFVLLLSVLLVVEGVSRCQLYVSTPNGAWGGDDATYPPAVTLAAAVGICFYGMFGIAVSFLYLVTGAGSHVVTLTLLACEFPLGWFFISVNVLSIYPFTLARAPGPMPGLTGTQSNAVIMMGFLGAFGVGVPLLAAHFFFVLQMARFQWGKAEIYTPTYYRRRTFFYSALVVFKGVAELALGGIVKNNIGSGRLAEPVVSIPFIINFPEISIADGVLVTFVGLLSLVIAGTNLNSLAKPFVALSFFTFVVQMALYDITQIGINGTDPLIVGSILVGATFTMQMMPAYLILEGAQMVTPASKDVQDVEANGFRGDI